MIHMAMVRDEMFGKTMRKSYAKYKEILEIPNMLKIQKDSYQWFLDEGLREVFRDVGTITDFSGKLELSFLDYTMEDKPKYTIEECKERDATYAKPIKVRVRLRNTETDEIKEQEIFMGDFPVMTNGGTFVINGAERVIISQISRRFLRSEPPRQRNQALLGTYNPVQGFLDRVLHGHQQRDVRLHRP